MIANSHGRWRRKRIEVMDILLKESAVEEWRDIARYEGLYQVSDHGRVRSLPHLDRKGRRVKGCIRKLKTNRPDRRVYVNLHKDGMGQTMKVYRLVATAFIGDCPEGYQVNHKDFNLANNCLSNLEYLTPRENVEYSRCHFHVGEASHLAKLKESEVREIRRLAEMGEKNCVISRQFGINHSTVSGIVSRKRWKHL